MNLVLLNRQSFEFVVVPDHQCLASAAVLGPLGVRSALARTRAVAVRQLRYREDSLRVASCPLLGGHRAQEAQIVAFDSELATPRLEVTDGAMPVEDAGGRIRLRQEVRR